MKKRFNRGTKRIIFLDFDGVINCARCIHISSRSIQPDDLSPCNHIAPLNKMIKNSDAQVVVSSSWRILHSVNKLQKILDKAGVICNVIGKTPNCWNMSRGMQIQTWLDEHPWVDEFIIIDDDTDMQHLSSKLLKTSWEHGLQNHHIDAMMGLFRADHKSRDWWERNEGGL